MRSIGRDAAGIGLENYSLCSLPGKLSILSTWALWGGGLFLVEALYHVTEYSNRTTCEKSTNECMGRIFIIAT